MASTFKIRQEGRVIELFGIYNHLTGKTGTESIGYNLNGKNMARISSGVEETVRLETLSNIFEVILTVPRGQDGTIDFSYLNLPSDYNYNYDWSIPPEVDFDFVNITTNANELILYIKNSDTMPSVPHIAWIKFETSLADGNSYTADIQVKPE